MKYKIMYMNYLNNLNQNKRKKNHQKISILNILYLKMIQKRSIILIFKYVVKNK